MNKRVGVAGNVAGPADVFPRRIDGNSESFEVIGNSLEIVFPCVSLVVHDLYEPLDAEASG